MPLSGINILDMTRVVSGPFCTMMLGDFGAEVIKVESFDGDPSRVTGITGKGENPYFVNLNRSKRSIMVNLKDENGKEIIHCLVKWADVLVENFRPGVMDRLGFGYDQLKKINSRLIYAAVSGFGKTGPYKDRPAFDFIAQAVSGFMSLNGDEDTGPLRVGIPISDTIAGLYTAFGILAALQVRNRTGEGQEVQCAMVDGLISMYTFASGAFFATSKLPPRNGNDHMVVSPYGLFWASDGPIAIAPSTHQAWLSFCKAIEMEELNVDPRFDTPEKRRQNRAQINEIVGARIRTKTKAEWIDILNSVGVPCGPINNLEDAFSDPQILHQEMLIDSPQPTGPVKMPGFPVKIPGAPARIHRPSPQLGGNTTVILEGIGYGNAEINKLLQDKVVKTWDGKIDGERL
jgi:CoA:oxalate CoA-transferase